MYGSGFPKSLNVAKAIDKASGFTGEPVGERIVDAGIKGHNSLRAGRERRLETQTIRAFSDEAAPWKGWGTCLKPAWEPVIVARKPLDGTVAHNVMEYGTGALNIDACRVGTDGGTRAVNFHGETGNVYGNGSHPKNDIQGIEKGRFPANLIHDGSDEVTEPMGSAARFFYCAKASKRERGEDNNHPTVKPQALMEYLVKMVTRDGAVVLDPFMGSGSTGVACSTIGREFVGIELDPAYYDIAKRRIEAA